MVKDNHICPECTAGKHDNCDGTAWCPAMDREVECRCKKAKHEW